MIEVAPSLQELAVIGTPTSLIFISTTTVTILAVLPTSATIYLDPWHFTTYQQAASTAIN